MSLAELYAAILSMAGYALKDSWIPLFISVLAPSSSCYRLQIGKSVQIAETVSGQNRTFTSLWVYWGAGKREKGAKSNEKTVVQVKLVGGGNVSDCFRVSGYSEIMDSLSLTTNHFQVPSV